MPSNALLTSTPTQRRIKQKIKHTIQSPFGTIKFIAGCLIFACILILRSKYSSSTTKSIKMSLKIVDATVSDFEQIFKQFESDSSPKLKFLLFLADKDPATNLTWCPDCNKAEPTIHEKLGASNSDVAVLRAYVGDKPTWRNPSHPWRTDPRFKLKGVPTLIRWENGGIVGRLEDYEAHEGEKIDALLTN